MKKFLSIFTISLFLSAAVMGQSINETLLQNGVVKGLKIEKEQFTNLPAKKSINSSAKTNNSPELDTLSDAVLPCFPDRVVNFRYDSGLKGYLNGTTGEIVLGSVPDTIVLMITEHGCIFDFPEKEGRNTRISSMYFMWGPSSKIVGSPDTFSIKIYTPGATTPRLVFGGNRAVPYIVQRFNTGEWIGNDPANPGWNPGSFWGIAVPEESDLFDDDNNVVYFNASKPMKGRNLITVETKTRTSDDTLTLLGNSGLVCQEADNAENWYVRMVDPINYNFVVWRNINSLYGLTGDNALAQPYIVPVISYNDIVSRDDTPLVTRGNFKLYPNFPNPAVDFTNIDYELNSPSAVVVRLFDTQGREVYQTSPQNVGPGRHLFQLNTEKYPCGIYHYRVETNSGALAGQVFITR